jgi:PAS domain S-box-containing protein
MIRVDDLPEGVARRLDELTRRAEEAEEALHAIRAGEVDALVVGAGATAQVFTLQGADYAHRVLLQAMSEGALTLAADGTILYANLRFAGMVGAPHERVVGTSLADFVQEPDRRRLQDLLRTGNDQPCHADLALCGPNGTLVLCAVALSPVALGGTSSWAVVVTDVTRERQQARDDLSEQQDWFRGALSSIGDAVVTTDTTGVVTFMNRVAVEMTGWATGIGKPIRDGFQVVNAETPAGVVDPVGGVLRAGAVMDLANHTLLRLDDGTARPIGGSAAPIRDATGNLLGVVLVFRDLSGRQRAEQALRASEERYRLAIEATNDAVWDVDLDTGALGCNEAYERAFGRPPAASAWWQWVTDRLHEADRGRVVGSLRAALDGLHDTWVCEYSCQRADGTWAQVYDRAFISRSASGKAVRVVGAMLDITDRKLAQEVFQQRSAAEIAYLLEKTEKILDNIPTGVLALSDAEVTVAANRALRRRMPPTALGAPLSAAFPEAPSGTILRLRQLIDRTRSSSQVQSLFGEVLDLFGEEERYNIHVVPLEPRFPDTRFLLVIEDLSEVRALEDQLLRAEKLATVGVLSSGIAHEIGTPLAVIRGRAECVLDRLGPDHTEAHGLRVLIGQIDHVTGIMRQLLDFARVKPAIVQPVAVSAIVRAVLELLRVETTRHGVSTFSEVSDALPDVAADPDQLQQVLVNLVMNACDACVPGGRVTVRARLGHAPEAGGSQRLRIEVVDDGCGIPAENQNQVFDPFFTTKKRGAGSGLGLSIVAQIARNHRAELDLESEPERGTCVTLRWPIAASAAPFEARHADPA